MTIQARNRTPAHAGNRHALSLIGGSVPGCPQPESLKHALRSCNMLSDANGEALAVVMACACHSGTGVAALIRAFVCVCVCVCVQLATCLTGIVGCAGL